MGPWGPFGMFSGKKLLFLNKFAKKSKFSSFLKLVSPQQDFKTPDIQKILDKISKKGTQKLLKWPFLTKNEWYLSNETMLAEGLIYCLIFQTDKQHFPREGMSNYCTF